MGDQVAHIKRGTYFTIYAPRQMGKTTLLRRLVERVSHQDNYRPIPLSFEAFEEWGISDFIQGFSQNLGQKLHDTLIKQSESAR